MLHRALFGSIERFFGVMVEHYGGAFPTWLSPVQVQVLGVRADHDPFAQEIVERLSSEGIRAHMVEADEPLGARIRKGKLEKLPYILVVGDDDVRKRHRRRESKGRRGRKRHADQRFHRANHHRSCRKGLWTPGGVADLSNPLASKYPFRRSPIRCARKDSD